MSLAPPCCIQPLTSGHVELSGDVIDRPVGEGVEHELHIRAGPPHRQARATNRLCQCLHQVSLVEWKLGGLFGCRVD